MKNQLLKNGFYNAVAGAVRIGLTLLMVPLLIRWMGVEEYGLWTFTSAVLAIVALAEAGLSTATTVFVAKDLANQDTDSLQQTLTLTIGLMTVLATFAAFYLYINADNIVVFLPKLNESQKFALVQAIQIGGIVVWSRLMQQVLIGIEQAYQRYNLISLLSIVQWTLICLGMLVIAWLGGRTVALMQWNALAGIITLLSHILVTHTLLKGVNLSIVWNRRKFVEIAHYCLITWLTVLGSALFSRGDRVLVGALLGAKVLGVYTTIAEIAGAINTFSALPVQPLLPDLSSMKEKIGKEASQVQQKIKQATEINSTVALSFGAVLFILAPLIMYIMLADKFTPEEVFAFRIATIIYALYSLNAVGYFVLYAVNGLWENFLVHLLSSVLSLVLIYFGCVKYGLIGAVLGNAGYLGTLLVVYYGMNSLNISFFTWIRWLRLPLFCFTSCITIGFFIVKI